MPRYLTDDQLAAYNRGMSHLLKAFSILGNVKVQGWQPHVLLYEVSEELELAMDNIADVHPNDLAPNIRVAIGEERKR